MACTNKLLNAWVWKIIFNCDQGFFWGVANRKCAVTCTKDFLGKNPNIAIFGGKKKLNSRYLDHRFLDVASVLQGFK